MNDTTANSTNKPESMPIGKSIPLVLAALVMVIGVSVLLIKLNLCIWVVWLGMCSWAAMGMSMNMKDIFQCWSSGAIGLFLGFMLTKGQSVFGTWALAVAGIILLLFVFGMVSHRFSFMSNNYTALFLTCCTASGITLEPLQLAESIVFGFLIFGLLPWGVMQLISRRGK